MIINALILYVRSNSIVPIALLNNKEVELNGKHLNPIWLYFYENKDNVRVDFGLEYRQHYEQNRPLYHGDILSKLWDEDATYDYGFTRRQMRYIFEDSGIWQGLSEAYRALGTGLRGDARIPLALCFHPEVKAVHQQEFVRLIREGIYFDLLAYGMPLESCAWQAWLKEQTATLQGEQVLAIQTLSPDMYISAFSAEQPLTLAKGQTFIGQGRDLRRRALVSRIVYQVNRVNRFLKSETEIQREIERHMHLHAEEWIARLDATSARGIPIRYNNISFACALNSVESATIRHSEVEADISRQIEALVDGIITEANSLLTAGRRYTQLLLIGDACQSQVFRKLLMDKLGLGEERVRAFSERDLALVLRAYFEIKPEALLSLEQSCAECGAEQLLRLTEDKEDRLAGIEEGKKRLTEEERKRLLREFQTASDRGNELLERREFAQALEFFEIARTKQPDNQSVVEKIDEVKRLILQEEEKERRYKTLIQQANEQEQQANYASALEYYRIALLEANDPSYVSERIEKISEMLELDRQAQAYLDRARIFLESKAYQAAEQELQKAQLSIPREHKSRGMIDELTAEVRLRLEELSLAEERLAGLRKLYTQRKLKQDYEEALQYLQELIGLDDTNSQHWLEEQLALTEALEKQRKQQAEIQKKLNDARNALFDDRWEQAMLLCREILALGAQEEASSLMERACQKQRRVLYDEIVKLANQGDTSIAEHKLKEYQAQYPDADSEVRQLRKTLFATSQHKPEVGSKTPLPPKKEGDDFFGSHSRSRAVPPSSTRNTPKDSFFD